MSTLSSTERETLEMALSFGMNPETSEPLKPEERAAIEEILKGEDVDRAELVPDATQAAAGSDDDLAAQVAAIQAQLNSLTTGGGPPGTQAFTFEDVLKQIDPRDSEASLAMFQWLVDNKRLSRVGTLDGGGYLLHYTEPKGTSKAGYTPGGTKGGRMVDNALDKAKASGAKPANKGMCTKCYSVVTQEDDGSVVLDDGSGNAACSTGGTHDFQPV